MHKPQHYSSFQVLALNVGVAFLYLIAGKLGLSLAFLNASVTAIWPPTGIALAALLFFGYRAIPGIFLGAYLVNSLITGNTLTSLEIAAGNTLEAIIGTYLVNKFANGVKAFEETFDIFKFTFLAGILATGLGATIGSLILLTSGLATEQTFSNIWITWLLGDMGGAVIITPLLLTWFNPPRPKLYLERIVLFFLSFLVLVSVTSLVFTDTFPYVYLCIPIAIWIAYLFGQRGATIASLVVAAMAVIFTLYDTGPFAHQSSLNESLILLSVFTSIFSLTGLTFSAAISRIRKGEKTLVSNQEQFKALIENSFDGVILIEASTRIIYASRSVQRLIGYTPEELDGMVGLNLVIPEDRPRVMTVVASLVLKPGGVTTIEYRSQRKDKKIIWVEVTGTNLLFEPNVHAIVINFRDITDKKISQEQILREKIVDDAMLDSIGEGIIATDSKGRISMVNPAACQILGCTDKDLMGKFMEDAVQIQDKNGQILTAENRPMNKVLTSGQPMTSPSHTYIRKDGTKIPIHFTLTPIILNGNLEGTIKVFYDSTKEKAIDKAKNEFVFLASHQLRTPLATINWYLEELIKKKDLSSSKQVSYFEEVYQASHRMVALINALLNASRLELGTFIVEPKEVSLTNTTNEVLNNLQPLIQEKSLTVEKDYPESLPKISADPKFLSIILQNLLSNAIKYSQAGEKIKIHLGHSKTGFTIRIADTGCGIPKHQQAKIFTKMFRADNARSLDPGGSGLGLYIVKEIVMATAGEVWFDSAENKGTVFTVTFPNEGMKKKAGQKQLR